jgi:phytoene dehydrogenase-like protein
MGGRWKVPVGGMGAISAALEAAAAGAGADLRSGAEALHVEHGPQTSEVTWREGDSVLADSAHWVLSGVAPATLATLEGRAAESPEGSQTKLNLLLERLPRLRSGIAPEDAFAGTFRLNEHEDDLESAYRAAAAGAVPKRLPAELYCHSLTDPSIVAPGHHTLTLFSLHTPARLFAGRNDELRGQLVERYLDALDEHLDEPIRDCLARDADGRRCIEAKTPLDVERELGMPGGNIFHGGLEFPWAEDAGDDRWGCATAHPRTFLCGSGARRGGCVSGVAGHNAAMAVLESR